MLRCRNIVICITLFRNYRPLFRYLSLQRDPSCIAARDFSVAVYICRVTLLLCQFRKSDTLPQNQCSILLIDRPVKICVALSRRHGLNRDRFRGCFLIAAVVRHRQRQCMRADRFRRYCQHLIRTARLSVKFPLYCTQCCIIRYSLNSQVHTLSENQFSFSADLHTCHRNRINGVFRDRYIADAERRTIAVPPKDEPHIFIVQHTASQCVMHDCTLRKHCSIGEREDKAQGFAALLPFYKHMDRAAGLLAFTCCRREQIASPVTIVIDLSLSDNSTIFAFDPREKQPLAAIKNANFYIGCCETLRKVSNVIFNAESLAAINGAAQYGFVLSAIALDKIQLPVIIFISRPTCPKIVECLLRRRSQCIFDLN